MTPFLRLFFKFMRATVSFGARHYYREIHAVGLENLQHSGPQIVVSNHPCTVMDALHAARLTKEQSFFLVNYSMFKNPIANFFLRKLYCIPIRRREYVAEGESRDNTEGFSQCYTFLRGGGTLFIAPEGSSFLDWKLRPLKTGTARIAFSAMQGNDLPFRLVPIGFTYFDGHLFGGSLHIHAGEPIDVRPFVDAYLVNPHQAYNSLTDYLANQMRPLLLDTSDKAQETVLYHADKLMQCREPLHLNERYQRLRNWADNLKNLETRQPDAHKSLTETAEIFAKNLYKYGVSHRNIRSPPRSLAANFMGVVGWLLALPLSVYGWLQHLFAAGLPLLGIWLTKPYIGYDAAFKFALGYYTFPLFYALQTLGVWRFSGNGWVAFAYLITLPMVGFIADWHTTAAKKWCQNRRWAALLRTKSDVPASLKTAAKKLLNSVSE